MNPAPVALIIDDEIQLRRLLRLALEAHGWRVYEAENGPEGLSQVAVRQPDVVLLDLGLPEMDGMEVLRRLREWSSVPVLIISVRDDSGEKVEALDLGADDYVTKPFGTGELLARLRAVMRRAASPSEASVFQAGALHVDLAARTVVYAGAQVHLTATEYALLRLLIRHAGKVVTHKQLLREVWGPQAQEQSHYLRVHLNHLREKIDPERVGLIRTEPRIGYRLQA